MTKAFGTVVVVLMLSMSSVRAEDRAPAEWDGLVKVESSRFDEAYLAPGADFSVYRKVMIDPTEAAFRRNWQRDYNNSSVSLQGRISDDEARSILQAAQSGLRDIFTETYTAAGYQVVTTPGPDVLRLRTGIVNLDVVAPDQMTAGRTRTYSSEAGEATLVLEARDSMSGALLGRGLDRRRMDDSFMMRRTSVSNRADFARTFRTWAQMSVNALERLRAIPAVPVNTAAQASH